MAINYGDYKEKTGLHCLRWLCEYVEENHEKGDKSLVLNLIGVHSHNPLGAENLLHMANSFKKHMGWNPDAFIAKPEFDIPGQKKPADIVQIKKPKIIT